MKTLYLLRHADAEPSKYYEDDRDRPLTASGQRDARRLGQFLAATDQLPDRFITSSAVRARQTAEEVPEGAKLRVEIPLQTAHALYQAEPADVLETIQSNGTNDRAVLIVGHEPAWSTTVSQLIGAANVSLPPGTCVRIDTDVEDWADIDFGRGTLRWMIPPKLLG